MATAGKRSPIVRGLRGMPCLRDPILPEHLKPSEWMHQTLHNERPLPGVEIDERNVADGSVATFRYLWMQSSTRECATVVSCHSRTTAFAEFGFLDDVAERQVSRWTRLQLRVFPGTDDGEIVELEVKAYRRVVHRRRYTPGVPLWLPARRRERTAPGTADQPGPVWHLGMDAGTAGQVCLWTPEPASGARPGRSRSAYVTGHARRWPAGHTPLFEPLGQALMDRLRSERHWHAHETRWAVFVDTEGRVGHRWYLWVFHARSVVHYVLDPARSAQVVTDELDSVKDAKDVRAVKKAILSCDRYSAYKKFARLHPGVVLAFCWAHQRRDFLELATRHPLCKAWALEWVDANGRAPLASSTASMRCACKRCAMAMAMAMRVALPSPTCTRPYSVWAIGASTRWPIRNSPRQRARCCRAWPCTGAG